MPRGTHHGTVIDNDDPRQLGRLRVECPTIVSGEALGDWILPKFHFVDSVNNAGSFWVPNIGSSIDVEIEEDPEAQINGFDPRWVCDVYPDGTVPDEFKENYPQRRGWKTGAGHILFFDDTEGSQEIHVVHATGASILITNDGRIELKPASGQAVFVGEDADEALMKGNAFQTFYNTAKALFDAHIHDVVGAATGAPTTTFPNFDSNVLSDLHKVK